MIRDGVICRSRTIRPAQAGMLVLMTLLLVSGFVGIASARDILDFSGTWQTKVNFGGQTYEGPITIIQTWSADKGYVTGTSIDGPSFTGEIDPYFGDVIKAQWIWTKVRPAGGDILFSVNAVDENRTLMSISGTAYYTNGAVAGDWYCYDRSTKITVPTVAPLPLLRVQSRTDYLGQNVTGDEGVEVLLSVWEPGPLHEVPVPGAIIQTRCIRGRDKQQTVRLVRDKNGHHGRERVCHMAVVVDTKGPWKTLDHEDDRIEIRL